jgi:uncharacterized protein (DUF2147 family)
MKNHQLNSKTLMVKNPFKSICLSRISATCLFITFSLFTMISNAQDKASDILGNYMVPSKDGAIQIYEQNGKYYGKIILNKDPNKLDVNNPKKELQSRKTLGLNILNDFTFDKGTWENGTIYDPKNGKTYSCKITMNANGDLNVRGFIGVSLIGRTEVFAKLKS